MAANAARSNRRLISDTNYYQWRKRAARINIPPDFFDQIWEEAARTAGYEGVEEIKDEIRTQEAIRYGI